jgi:hypothetical protein
MPDMLDIDLSRDYWLLLTRAQTTAITQYQARSGAFGKRVCVPACKESAQRL